MEISEGIYKAVTYIDQLKDFISSLECSSIANCAPKTTIILASLKIYLESLQNRHDFIMLNLIFLEGLIIRLLFYLSKLTKFSEE